MTLQCTSCGHWYDDAEHLTYCPHALIMPKEDLAQKVLGLSLLGQRVVFVHDEGQPPARVCSVSWNGMVTLEGWGDVAFAPHLFRIVPRSPDPDCQNL